MAENRVRVVIEADPTGAISSLGDFRRALEQSGATAKLTDDALCKLADRFRDKLSADKATAAAGKATEALKLAQQQIERIGQAAGLSQRETANLSRQLGVMPAGGGGGGFKNFLADLTAGNESGINATAAALETLAIKAAAAATAYVTLKEVMGFVKDSVMYAARYQTLEVVLEKVGENAGYTKSQMLGFAEGVEQAGISMIDSRESVAKMATAELDLSKAVDLARVAQGAAVVTGQNSSDVFAKLVQGIATGQTILLHHQGIMVNLEDAYKAYAKQLGVTKDLLTETDKRQAALNAVLDFGARYAGVYEAAMGTAGKQLTSFDRYISDLKTTLGEADLSAFTSVIFDAADSIKQLQEVIKDPETQAVLAQMGEGLAIIFRAMIEGATSAAKEFVEVIKAITTSWDAIDPDLKTFVKYGLLMGAGAIVGGAKGGLLGAAIGAGTGAWTAAGFPTPGQAFDNWRLAQMYKHAEEMNEALYREKDPVKQKQLEADLNAQLEFIDDFQNKKMGILEQYNKEASKSNKRTVDPSNIPVVGDISAKDQADALNKWWAEYNKGLKKYKELVDMAEKVGEKNKGHAPIEAQKADAKKTFDAEQTAIGRGWMAAYDAGNWEEIKKLNDAATASLGAYNDKLDELDRKATKGAKSAEAAAIAADRYEATADAFYDQTVASLDQMQDSLSGGMEKSASRTDKWFAQMFDAIRRKTVGAKGDVSAYAAAWAALEQAWPGLHMLAVLKDTVAALEKESQLLQTIASATGDPAMAYAANLKSAQAWYIQNAQLVTQLYTDASQRAAMLAKLRQGYEMQILDAKVKAYASVKEVSSTYWAAEKARLTAYLAQVKAAADDATAYRIYAAEQWDAYNKRLLERQASYSGDFASIFTAKWSLAFGTYKNDLTRARDDFQVFADSCITLTQGIAGAISGGLGDALRRWADKGTLSVDTLFQNMRSRMVDSFASFVEENWKKQLTSGLGDLGSWLFGSSATGQTAKQITTPQAAIEASQATISIASASIAGISAVGDATFSGKQLGDAIGSATADSLATKAFADNGLILGTNDGVSTLISKAAMDIAAKYESGGNYGSVSSGKGDIGGVSYGRYQFASNTGTVQDFFKTYGYSLDALGSWKSLAAQSKFQDQQDEYAARKFYTPVIDYLEKIGADVENQGTQAAAFAAALAHGPDTAITIINRATGGSASGYSTSDLINAIYNERMRSSEHALLAYWKNSPYSTQQSVYNRLASERSDVLALSGSGGSLGQIRQLGSAMGDSIMDTFSSGGSSSSFLRGLSDANISGFRSLFDTNPSTPNFWSDYSDRMTGGLASNGLRDAAASGLNWSKLFGNVASMATGVLGFSSALGSGNAGGAIGSGLMTLGGGASLLSTLGIGGALMGPIGAGLGIVGGLIGSIFGGSQKSKRPPPDYAVGYSGGGNFSVLGFTGNANTSTATKELYQMLKTATQSLKTYAKSLDLSTTGILNFNVASSLVYAQYMQGYEDYIKNTQVETLLDRNGVRGAFDYINEGGEDYTEQIKRLSAAMNNGGQYMEAFGYNLKTLSGVTEADIAAMRQEAIDRAGVVDAESLYLGLINKNFSYLQSLFDAIPGNIEKAQNASSEHLQELYIANYVSKLQDAAGGEDAFKTVMGNLEKKQNNPYGQLQTQESYYATKSNSAIALIGGSGITVDNFWTMFNAAMQQVMTPDQFEKWAYASNFVANLNTIQDSIETWNNNIEKISQSLNERKLTAAGFDKTAAATKLLADQEWELYDARKASYDATTLAAIAETQQAERAKTLQDMLDDAQSTFDSARGYDSTSELRNLRAKFEDEAAAAEKLGATESALTIRRLEEQTVAAKLAGILATFTDQTLTDDESWLKDLNKSTAQAIANAQALGASEQALSRIRQTSTELIAKRLSDMMDDIRKELSSYNDTALSYNVTALKKELSDKLYSAALLGASETDLTDIGTLYAYKVKAAYQDQIDTIVEKLQDAADALDTFSGSLKDLIDELWRKDDSPLPLADRYAEAKRQWLAAGADLTSSDDATRKVAQGKIETLTTDYLDLSKQYNASFDSYYADFMQVQTVLGEQYKTSKSQYDRIKAQLDAATATEESAKTTAELMEQLKSLQQEQGDTWTRMLADLPRAIADAVAAAASYRQSLGYATGGLVSDLARSGGYLPGYSAGDVQPAVLRLGEYVMTPEAVGYYGVDYFEALNGRRILPVTGVPGFSGGGYVGRQFAPSAAGTDGARADNRPAGRGYAALAGQVASLTRSVERMSDRLDKRLVKVADNTGRIVSVGVKVLQETAA